MAGLFGFVAAPPPTGAEEALGAAMAAALGRHDGAHPAFRSGPGWAIGAARPGDRPAIARRGRALGVAHGRPRLASSDGGAEGALEALLEAFLADRDPLGVLARWRGPFAVALIAPEEGRAFVATDRVGVETLYYRRTPGGLVFASRLPALRLHPAVPREVCAQAVFDYLYHHVIPAPRTIYEGVERLRPGEALELRGARVERHRYWHPRYERERERIAVAALKPEFDRRLDECVSREARAEPALGCFLSGGTDSSTVAGRLGRVTGVPARTFSIGFAEPGYDETGFARIAARHFATEHHERYVTPEDIVGLVPRIAEVYGTPFGNSSVIPAYHCAVLAREHGVRRLLGGDGGDELFGGNERYARQKVFAAYDALGPRLRARLEGLVLHRAFPSRPAPLRKLRRYVEQARVPMPERMETYNLLTWFGVGEVLAPEFLAAVDPAEPVRHLAAIYSAAEAATMLNRMLALDLEITLADNDLPKVGGMCELAGLEVGYPLLDDDMVDFAARLPVDLKVKGLRLRHFFKEALRDFLPPEIITKSKHGFGLPFGRWLVTHARLRELAFDSLAALRGQGIVRPAFVDRLIREATGEDAHYVGTLVWILMILEQWQRRERAEDPARVPSRSASAEART